jgi:iron complex transport system substrate-binding protein
MAAILLSCANPPSSGCGRETPRRGVDQPRAEQPRAEARIAVTDDLGRAVTLARPARRIASLSPSNTEILFSLSCGDRVVLRDRLSSYPSEARRLPATNPFQLSPDHVVGFDPDLVLLSHADAGRVEALRQLGLAVATFDPKNLEGMFSNIRAIGALCGVDRQAGHLVSALSRRVQAVRRRVQGRPRPAVYIETDGTDPLKPWTAGPGSFVDELVRLAGGRNVAAHLDRPYAQVNAEEILSGKPDVILVMGVAETRQRGLPRLRGREGWSSLEAVRRGRVIDSIHADLLSRPGPRLVDGLEALARALHPEVRR